MIHGASAFPDAFWTLKVLPELEALPRGTEVGPCVAERRQRCLRDGRWRSEAVVLCAEKGVRGSRDRTEGAHGERREVWKR